MLDEPTHNNQEKEKGPFRTSDGKSDVGSPRCDSPLLGGEASGSPRKRARADCGGGSETEMEGTFSMPPTDVAAAGAEKISADLRSAEATENVGSRGCSQSSSGGGSEMPTGEQEEKEGRPATVSPSPSPEDGFVAEEHGGGAHAVAVPETSNFCKKTVRVFVDARGGRWDDAAQDAVLAYMNTFFVVDEHSNKRPVYVELRTDEAGLRYCVTRTRPEFREYLASSTISGCVRSGKKKRSKVNVRLGNWWLEHPERRTVDRTVFDPRSPFGVDGRTLNAWRGFAIGKVATAAAKVTEDDAQPLVDHIKRILCKGDEAEADYVLDWMAHTLQRPWEKPGVALVVIGEEGAGKGVVFEKFGAIVGKGLFKKTSNPSAVLGQFNASMLRDSLVVFLDEASRCTSQARESQLKSLVTESTVTFQAKHRDSEIVDSHHRVILASNDPWVINAPSASRRYLVLEADDRYSGPETSESREHFRRVLAVPPEAFALYLYGRDISEFSPRSVPRTETLQNQQECSLRDVEAWWYECLCRGHIVGSTRDRNERPTPLAEDQNSSTAVNKEDLRKACERSRHCIGPIASNSFFRRWYKCLGGKDRVIEVRPGGQERKRRNVEIPSLPKLMDMWCRSYGNHWRFEDECPEASANNNN